MQCPACSATTHVLESREADHGAAVRRRRECTACGERFTTFERPAVERLYVRKRDGRRQPFDAEKLRGALVRAVHKRDVSARDLDGIVRAVEAEGRSGGGTIAADRIGELCLDGLGELDRGAYMQFAGTLATPPSSNADFAGVSTTSAGSVPSGPRGSMANPRKSVSKERLR